MSVLSYPVVIKFWLVYRSYYFWALFFFCFFFLTHNFFWHSANFKKAMWIGKNEEISCFLYPFACQILQPLFSSKKPKKKNVLCSVESVIWQFLFWWFPTENFMELKCSERILNISFMKSLKITWMHHFGYLTVE